MNSIIKKNSRRTGKTLAVFCGVHGNEKAGIFAVKKILKDVKIKSGTVYFVFANPRAIKQNKRFIEKNLNRCFVNKRKGNSYEEKRAIRLMKIMDKSDALLDVHASNNPKTTPFAITDNGLDIVKNMNFKIIATGFDDVEPGATDGYMKRKKKVGICLECGYSGKSKRHTELAYNSIIQFLQYFDAIEKILPESKVKQKVLIVDKAQKVTSNKFKLTKTFADFQTIKKGSIIARDEFKKYIAEKEGVILFGTPGKPIGAEAYILGTWAKQKSKKMIDI